MDPTAHDGDGATLPPGRCPRCLHRLEWCLCPELPRIETRTRIVIVRAHAERFRSSNTGRLAHLALPGSALVDVGGPGRLEPEPIDPAAWLLWPEGEPVTEAPVPPPPAIIALDASWHQARRMRQKFATLRRRPVLALAPVPAAERMRKAPIVGHVSTIEAIAAVLRLLGEADAAEGLDRAFALAIERQKRSGRKPHGAT